MLETLISSKTRIKLLYKFFLNSSTTSYLRGLEEEFNESTNSVRLELNKFERAGFLVSSTEGNKKVFKANTSHPLFKDINRIVLKLTGIDHIVDYILQRIGKLEKVYLVGSLAKGIEGEVIDLVLVGDINKAYLIELIGKAEKKLNKKIKFICYLPSEFELDKIKEPGLHPLLIWSK
ncbi:MAG: transcriptional regulator [Bacteroidetes bacterium]|jgi:predicted nucleotidyltransferase|nr:transcriptional regulator [Bacteroidota bacterium]